MGVDALLMSPGQSIQSIASVIVTAFAVLSVLIVVSGVVAFLAAHKWGGKSRPKRQAIYTIVGSVGLIIAAIVTSRLLRRG
jgi:hypothetical protein